MVHKQMIKKQSQFFNTWKSIIKKLHVGGTSRGTVYTKWNYDLNAVQVKRNVPNSQLCIDISMGDMGDTISIDLVDLSKTEYMEYYLQGYEFNNTFEEGIEAVEYLYDLIKKL
jgi:hypothetical protein